MAGSQRRRILVWGMVGAVLAAGVALVASRRVPMNTTADEVPIATVERGAIDLKVHATGELRASHSITLTAPAVGGDALQIIHLIQTGQPVKKGDVVIGFDPSEQRYKLEQNRSELLQAEQDSSFDIAPGDRDGIVAGALLTARSAAIAILGDDGIAAATAAAFEQTR